MVRREDETLTHGPASGGDETLTHNPASGTDETLTRGAGAGSDASAPELDSEPGWESGSLVDNRWEVFGSARGGMGRVYFVRDRQWGGTTLAVKSLLLRGNATPDKLDSVRALFRRETQVWLDVGAHQNIVSGFYTLEVGGVLRFFMEYVSGQSLAEVVARGGLELPRALDLAIQLCAGMQYVHARNVVHRDLKPANCLIMEDDTLRVTDFGLGKSTGDVDAITSAGSQAMQGPDVSMHHAGTPYYMAPEQWQSLGAAGKPADVYAFGVMLYELFAGLRPFGADPNILRRYSGNVPPMLQQLIDGGAPIEQLVLQLFHQQASPFALSTVRPDLPRPLAVIAQTCLDKDPGARPAFGPLRDELVRRYADITGHPYRRQLPDALRPSEAGENNRAVSYYTMGEHDKACAILDGWLANDPKALYPWINRQTIGLRHREVEPADVADRFALEIVRSHPGAVDDDDSVGGFARKLAPYRLDHPAKVLSIAVSPDGSAIATGCEDRSVRVFDVATGALQREYRKCHDMVMAVVFCGGNLVAGGNGAAIEVWDRETGATRSQLVGHGDLVTSLSMSVDGALWSASNDRTARCWDLASGVERARLKKHKEIVRNVAVSPNGSRVATCSFDGQVRVWSAPEARLLSSLEDKGVVQTVVAFAPDGRTLWTGGTDGALRQWETETGTCLRSQREHQGGLAALAVGGDGAMIATGGADRVVRLWDATTGRVVRAFAAHRGPVRALRFLGGNGLVTASDDHTARVWPLSPAPAEHWPLCIRRDAAVGGRRELAQKKQALMSLASQGRADVLEQMRAFRGEHDTYRRDDELLAAEHALGLQRGTPVGCRDAFVSWTEKTSVPVAQVAFSPTGDAVYASTEAGLLRFSTDRSERIQIPYDQPAPIACQVSRDGTSVLVADTQSLRLVGSDPAQGAMWDQGWGRGAGAVHAAAMSSDASVVIAGGWSRSALKASWQAQGTLRGWRTHDGARIKFKNKGNAVLSVAVSDDGALIAAGMDDGDVALWDARCRSRLRVLTHPGKPEITAVALSRAGDVLASGGADGSLRLWRPDFGKMVAGCQVHTGPVTSISISDDSRFLLSAGYDGNVSLHLCRELEHLRTLEGHAETAVAAFGPGARQLVSGGRDRVVRLWTLDIDWRLS